MSDRTLPIWVKIVLVVSALMQVGFGLRLLFDPASISSMWPWPMTVITARLLGASTLVSVPMALLSVWFNRYSAARLPMIMIICYRVLQLAAGFMHFERFDLAAATTWNYFGGGAIMLVALGLGVLRGPQLGEAVSGAHPFLRGDAALEMGAAGRLTFRFISVLFILLGVTFFALGKNGEWLWFEAPGNLTSLTARLFASPMFGLGVAAWVIANSKQWRQVGLPALGMATFGVAGVFALIMDFASVQPPTAFGYVGVVAPVILLGMGAYLLMPGRAAA